MGISNYFKEKIEIMKQSHEEQKLRNRKIAEERKEFRESMEKEAFEKRKEKFRKAFINESTKSASERGKMLARQRFGIKEKKPFVMPNLDIDEINSQVWGERKRPERTRNPFDIGLD